MFTREWLEVDLAVRDGHVVGLGDYDGETVVDCRDVRLIPGLIDAHVHIESSKLVPAEFARAVVPHGTTAVVADPHEIANVLGVRGVRWMLDASEGLPLAVFMMAPSCVPASPFESPLGALGPADLEELLRHPRVIGLGEMMNYPGVVAGDPAELAKLAAARAGRPRGHADGHAPGLSGRALNAYVAAGIDSDHEAVTAAEALEKRRLGMWVLLREASIARNLRDLLPLVRTHGPELCALCTDDREPDFLVREGHLDQMLRVAVEGGVAAEDAILMATLHPARCHGLARRGALAPGYRADVVLLDDLRRFEPRAVYVGGAEPIHPRSDLPGWLLQTMNLAAVTPDTFRVTPTTGPIRVIGVVPGQLLTRALEMEPAVQGGACVAAPDRDLVKIAVVERHHATGRVGLGFATGVGLRRGAYAATVAHDAHNVVVLGVDDRSMATCVRRLAEIGGGLVVAEGETVLGELPLPVAGLMSDRPLVEVDRGLERLQVVLSALGVVAESPFMTLSFLALSVIPELKITDRGLVDVNRFELVPLAV
ncbi:MAG: adenine deaminase [Candidatus Dormibacteraeota bacterium]|nr:adenine deaminase [Candidatus Dormibacteraeota bacterium]